VRKEELQKFLLKNTTKKAFKRREGGEEFNLVFTVTVFEVKTCIFLEINTLRLS
jgi:thiamine monophosphate kinase